MRKVSVTAATIVVALAFAAGASAGAPAARLIVPKLHLNVPVGRIVDAGPAFYPGSGRPGQPYTIAIAGHRTTHTRPFWSLDQVARGDKIVIVWHGRPHPYTVTSTRVVAPSDWSAAEDLGHERLILSTCTPRFTARQRLIVI